MVTYRIPALRYVASCYPVLRFAKWAEHKYGGVRMPS